ncbi:TetR/AcrR family transcriptional regulator [Agromyces seonyuensis]|uniref:TetR family transcriptional regulator n=1 Tax=Agromyces seonyuensis TaxID=2662446 RepID=A0A6I4NU75_9MICO|nr:TetR/AcrR family transcriptional regulator [Agromyces seonyuensis]MWB97793.1 TetR family transcriptional regulator [Agromyces seonyuensis]
MPVPKAPGTPAPNASSRNVGGRPRRSSRATLEDAASELFLEQGYAATTIDQIAQRAGVGRNTFFSYFGAKSDLLWLDADPTLELLPAELAAAPADLPPTAALAAALHELASRHPHSALPIALSQRESMATLDEFLRAGLPRFLAVRSAIAEFLADRSGRTAADPIVRAAAAAITAAVATGAGDWALAGSERGPLADAVDLAVAPVLGGFASLLNAR